MSRRKEVQFLQEGQQHLITPSSAHRKMDNCPCCSALKQADIALKADRKVRKGKKRREEEEPGTPSLPLPDCDPEAPFFPQCPTVPKLATSRSRAQLCQTVPRTSWHSMCHRHSVGPGQDTWVSLSTAASLRDHLSASSGGMRSVYLELGTTMGLSSSTASASSCQECFMPCT